MAARLVRTSVVTLVVLLLLGSCRFFEDPEHTNPMDPQYSGENYQCLAVSSGANFTISWTRFKGTDLTAVHVITSVVPDDIRNAVRNYSENSNSVKDVFTTTSLSLTNTTWAKSGSFNTNVVNYFAVIYQSKSEFEGSSIDSVP